MTKKKPDFLRDLDTAIMDELTGGGIKGNVAGLVGTLRVQIHTRYGDRQERCEASPPCSK